MTMADALHVLKLIQDHADLIRTMIEDDVDSGRCPIDGWNEAINSFGGYLDSALLLMERAAEYYAENAPENIITEE